MISYHKPFICVVLLLSFLGFTNPASAVTIYVDQNVVGGENNGSSWANAYIDLQDALDAAELDLTIDQIWVATGTYYPSEQVNGVGTAYQTFQLINGVEINGGFAGTETALDQRDIQANETILSGNIGDPGNSSDNCFHVFFHPAVTALNATAVLDGFTITAGNADDVSWPHNSGGGMFNEQSSPTVINCTFSGNTANDGGGLYNDAGSSPIVTDCTFSGNTASDQGGGMYNFPSSNPSVTGCTFSENTALTGGGMYNSSGSSTVTGCIFSDNTADFDGGGMYNLESSPTVTDCIFSGNSAENGGGLMNDTFCDMTVTNCTFSGNSAVLYGGGMENFDNCDPTVINCSFSGNTASDSGGGMDNYLSDPAISNSIFWGNTATFDGDQISNDTSTPVIAYSNIQGVFPAGSTNGGGNISSDPLYVDADGTDNIYGTEDDDLQLQDGSPCINAGDNTAVPGGVTTDLAGQPRISGGIVDMGAYEDSYSLTVTAPVGGAVWTAGQAYDITWTGSLSGTVWLGLYYNGQVVTYFAYPEDNDGSYTWTIPIGLAAGDAYQVRVNSFENANLYGLSDPFEITLPTLTVSDPSAGSVVTMGDTDVITWSGMPLSADTYVWIGLYKNNQFAATISTAAPNTGSFTWTGVPYSLVPGEDYQVRVVSYDNLSIEGYSDSFTIQTPYVVTLPVSSTVGESIEITWTGSLSGTVWLGLYYNGQVVTYFAYPEDNDGSYTWTIPTWLPAGTAYQVRVNSFENANLYGLSDPFEITLPTLTVSAPSAGSVVTMGDTDVITWSGMPLSADTYVWIGLYKNNQFAATISTAAPNTGSFTWTGVPYSLVPGEDYQVRVVSYDNLSIGGYSDSFTIQTPYVVTSPVSSTVSTVGESIEITWTGSLSGTVWLGLYYNGQVVMYLPYPQDNDGSYTWTIPIGLPAGDAYQVRVNSFENSNLYGLSDPFEITLPTLTVSAPSGGSVVTMGDTDVITWSGMPLSADTYVWIGLYKNNQFAATISTAAPNTGSFTWTGVPYSLVPGDDYQVRVVSYDNLSIGGYSDSFTIQPP